MNRNTFSRFSLAPQVSVNRAAWHRDSNLKTSFNVGDLIPIYVDEVLPGDEFSIKTSKVLRLQTLLTPVMDNLWFDVYYFFVPNRLVWNHWQELMGENTDSAWIPQVEYSVPQLEAPSGGWNIGTIADYMGVPTGVSGLSVNALPFRAYALIVDSWFRDQNNQAPINIPLTDSTVTGVNTGTFTTDLAKGGLPFTAAKYHDYFTSCLPAPQKGPSVPLPLGDAAPVFANQGVRYLESGSDWPSGYGYIQFANKDANGKVSYSYAGQTQVAIDSYGNMFKTNTSNSGSSIGAITPANLYADLSVATASTINELRNAFQIQRMLEKDARGGSRYISLLKSHFGVSSPDARLQRPEYLGGNRFAFNVEQVAQTSSTDAVTPQGNLSGYSLTFDYNNDFSKGFVEHGFIIGVAVARYEHSYQQGLERFWSRTGRFDYYWPALAHIGEQAVLNQEIFAQGTTADEQVFGYQEAWADYRYKPSRITGEMRSAANVALDSWHFADEYSSLPTLSDGWIREDKSNVDRTLAVGSSVANQIFGDLYFDCKVTRPMPLYSIPGLIDHF